jgi:hypothetical protein
MSTKSISDRVASLTNVNTNLPLVIFYRTVAVALPVFAFLWLASPRARVPEILLLAVIIAVFTTIWTVIGDGIRRLIHTSD